MGDTRATVIIFQAHMSGELRVQNETVQTLTAAMGTGGNNTPLACYSIQDGKDMNYQQNGLGHAVVQSTVRRLTPVECERLQGFPDGWTEGQTDGHRYKQMGNAVAVPVVEWIMGRLVANDEMV